MPQTALCYRPPTGRQGALLYDYQKSRPTDPGTEDTALE